MDAQIVRRSTFEDRLLLRMPCRGANENPFKITHFWFQRTVYHKSPGKSIPKKQQNFLKNSTINTPPATLIQFIDFYTNRAYSSYILNNGTFQLKSNESSSISGPTSYPLIHISINMPPHVYHYLFVIMFSVTDLRVRGLILFWVSSQPALRLFLYLQRCCCCGKSRFQRFSNEPSFPATHGLKENRLTPLFLNAHAALVSQNKPAHELHELPRIEKHICHKGSKAQRNTKRIIIKKERIIK
jgi:hypothetical protein